MENKEMLIGGFTIEQLKKLQKDVQKDASKIISNAVSTAQETITAIIDICKECEDIEDLNEEDIRGLAKIADDNLKLAEMISGISGVEYFVNYNEVHYDRDGVLSSELNNLFDYDYPDCLSGVIDTLESMEHQSYLWNSSSIGC